jgi:hypothetical protein
MARFWHALSPLCVTAKQRFKGYEMAMSSAFSSSTPARHNQASVQLV